MLEKQMHASLGNDNFCTYYQPQFNRTGGIIGMEALVRWNSQENGNAISPSEFIPIAEKSGLIKEIGRLVLRNACQQNRRWQEMGYPPMRVAVNLSPFQFRQPDLLEDITSILEQTGLAPVWLELEITESGIMQNEEDSIQKLYRLHDMGVAVSIDDFGTGYSSLSKLRVYPIDTLKIDKSFVDDLPGDRMSTTIATTIIELAHNLGFKVIAEGVEKKEQLSFLLEKECDYFQGYHFSRPIPPEEFERLLKK